jgi:hypothetical protein
MSELGIRLIFAYSAQARGRGERINRTFQDRLVAELRLAKIATPEEATGKDENLRFSTPRCLPEMERLNAFLAILRYVYALFRCDVSKKSVYVIFTGRRKSAPVVSFLKWCIPPSPRRMNTSHGNSVVARSARHESVALEKIFLPSHLVD